MHYKKKAQLECEADFASMNTVIPCTSQSSIERQFQMEYTHAKFKEVQVEFRLKMNCVAHNVLAEGQSCRFDVVEESFCNERTKHMKFEVSFNRGNFDISCTCLLFEFRGILCRHCLVVLAQEKVPQVPMKYVLSRWSKNLRRKHTYIRASSGMKDNDPQIHRYDGLCKKFYDIAELASASTSGTEQLHKRLDDFLAKHMDNQQTCTIVTQPVLSGIPPSPMSPNHITLNMNNEVRSPIAVKRKGRPRSTRKKSWTERGPRVKTSSSTHQVAIMRNSERHEQRNFVDVPSRVCVESQVNMNTCIGITHASEGLSVPIGASIGFLSLLTSLDNSVNNSQHSSAAELKRP
ncbi:protein FAR1-RELATED SEQUENCE 2-like [Phaseolus vulgaris]|uniref:protein FAR1-RELATED SEQUENCE 2-like n=1 Tax=Phaseolus vulgaris TaxID=3885 RepID=UPI0035CC3040